MLWLDKRSVLRLNKKNYAYGEEIPIDKIDKKKVAQLKDRGQIGESVSEKSAPKSRKTKTPKREG